MESRDVYVRVKKKSSSIAFARGCRIHLSKRLANYDRLWNFIFFAMNIEAVIIVVLSLTKTVGTITIGSFSMPFDLFAGMFTLYVILLQYYINALNYSERSYRSHYHQIELEDWTIALDKLVIKMEEKLISRESVIDVYHHIVSKYQLSIKNNENHSDIDFRRTSHEKKLKEGMRTNNKALKDLSLDIMLIGVNTFVTISIIAMICYVVIF